ncbi:MAG: ABC transporter substrate-binding protein [Spirochaetota bacterium]|nr:ABC transporter substrate-binding protein [Spirochaetota bacterium]
MKYIFRLFIVIVLICLLSKCHNSEKVIIRIAGNVHSHLNELIPIFEAKNPHIKVEIVDMRYPPGSKLVNSNRTHDAYVGYLSTANSDIDIYEIDVIWLTEFVKYGWVQSLDEYFPKEKQNLFLEGILKGTQINNHVWAVQEWVDFGLMYYRKDILDKLALKPPVTWEELLSFAKIAKNNKMSLLSFQGNNYEGLICFFNELIRSFGGSVFNTKGKLEITSPQAQKALQLLVYLKKQNLLPEHINRYTEESTHKDFLSGKSLFSRNWPYVYKLASYKEWNMQEKIGMIPIPKDKNHPRHYGTTGGWMLVMSKYSENRNESWKLMEFLTSEEIQKHLFQKHGLVPTRKKLFNEYTPKKLPGLESYLIGQDYLSPRPMDQNYREISRILSQKIWEAMTYWDIKDTKTQLGLAETEINSIINRKSRLMQKKIK